MPVDGEDLDLAAERYAAAHGEAAYKRVGDEISAAIGAGQWDRAYYLQRLQWRIRKLEQIRQEAGEARGANRRVSRS